MGIYFGSLLFAVTLSIFTVGSTSCFSQTSPNPLMPTNASNYEVIGNLNLGTHKSSRSESDTLSFIVVYVPATYVRQPFLTEIVPKIASKMSKSESYFMYFLDDREQAKVLLHVMEIDGGTDPDLRNSLKATKAVFVCIKSDNKEFLRLYENGMTEKDEDALGVELDN